MGVTSRTEEIRLAMAWNGGVSLAIWMGGAAVEFDAARRARLADAAGPPEPTESGGERSIYAALCEAFDRALVIDILAGASAGGINGALLGAVITHGRVLRPEFVRERWLDLGDLGTLLQPTDDTDPPSLMRGDYFAEQLTLAFEAVTGELPETHSWSKLTKPERGLKPAEVVLDVQTTNLAGKQQGFADEWGQTLYAFEYRAPIRFRRPEDYTSDALAGAARASASFPAAFAPYALVGKGARLGGFPGVKRWMIDGGLLENAPIRPAIDLIPTRLVVGRVTRYVCYVNAAPPVVEKAEDDPAEPSLRTILGNVVNLPREGRFIDQLLAIEQAIDKATATTETASALLRLEPTALETTANELLFGYCQQRTAQSLRELIVTTEASPTARATAIALAARLEANHGSLPWIPSDLAAPDKPADWRWGLRAAQRVLLLQLDLLRTAIDTSPPETADVLLGFRAEISASLVNLEDARERFFLSRRIRGVVAELTELAADDKSAFTRLLGELERLMVGFRCEIYDALRRGTRALDAAYDVGEFPDSAPTREHLFGGLTDEESHFSTFLHRALCIEVIRRAFGPEQDLQTEQPLRFVQITPLASVRLFSRRPLRPPGRDHDGNAVGDPIPASGKDKLTGLRYAHFSAFYRRSWRANDFMWGRLDGATRIVDLLVSAERAMSLVAGDAAPEPWTRLAEALVPLDDGRHCEDKRLLATEALLDVAQPGPFPAIPAGVAAAATGLGDVPSPQKLRDVMTHALKADLSDLTGDGGFFTRLVCARAAQYEVMCQELEPLSKATALDRQLGCFTDPIPFNRDSGILDGARRLIDGGPLPQRLGIDDPDERTSTLAVRTLAHAGLVGVASLKTLGVPLSSAFGVVRAPLSMLVGITAENPWNRVAARIAFVAGSWYIAARSVSAKPGTTKLSGLWDPSTLAMLVAVFAVTGLVFLPLWRVWQSQNLRRRATEAAWGIGLLVSSGLASLVFVLIKSRTTHGVSFANVLVSTDGFELPSWLAWMVFALPLGTAVALGRAPLPGIARSLLARLQKRPLITALTTAGVSIAVMKYSWSPLASVWGANHVERWRAAAVIAAYTSILVSFSYGLKGFASARHALRGFRQSGRS